MSVGRGHEVPDSLLRDVLEARQHPQLLLQLLLVGPVLGQVPDGLPSRTTAQQRRDIDASHLLRVRAEAHQEGGVDHLGVGVVQEQDEARQAALVLDDGPAVHGVGRQVPQLVDDGQRVRLCAHGPGWPIEGPWGQSFSIHVPCSIKSYVLF